MMKVSLITFQKIFTMMTMYDQLVISDKHIQSVMISEKTACDWLTIRCHHDIMYIIQSIKSSVLEGIHSGKLSKFDARRHWQSLVIENLVCCMMDDLLVRILVIVNLSTKVMMYDLCDLKGNQHMVSE